MMGSFFGGGEPDETPSSAPEAPSAQSPVELRATTEYLEYSDKDIDPTTLVKVSDADAKVTCNEEIDLRVVGLQEVVYQISSGNQSVEQKVSFTVRDTRAPVIKLAAESASIEQGSSYDPHAALLSVSDEVDGALELVSSPPEAKGSKAGVEQFYDKGWYVLEGSIDSSTPGTYPIKITAADKHGNVAAKELKVTVKEPAQETTVTKEAPPAPVSAAAQTYILNTNTGKFHISGCASVRQMKNSNKMEVSATRDEMIANGYSPCGRCNP